MSYFAILVVFFKPQVFPYHHAWYMAPSKFQLRVNFIYLF